MFFSGLRLSVNVTLARADSLRIHSTGNTLPNLKLLRPPVLDIVSEEEGQTDVQLHYIISTYAEGCIATQSPLSMSVTLLQRA